MATPKTGRPRGRPRIDPALHKLRKPTGRPRGRPKKPENIPLERRFKFHTTDTNLPHLNGFKFYHWSRTYFESTNRMNLLTAANQLGKSTTQIRKCIHWATETSLWHTLWSSQPRAFFYVYPDQNLLHIEFESRWIPELLPRGPMRTDKKYGWEPINDRGKITGIRFASGVIVWFKTYSQKVSALQGTTLHAVFVDEELPPKYFPELQARLNATAGYFHQCFTATTGWDLWRSAMNPGRGDRETFPGALKQTVSLYDCLTFEDGSPGQYTEERIKEVERQCGTEVERRRRVMGEFVNEEGIKFSAFDPDLHMVKPFPIGPEYLIYSGIDIGSGLGNHPAAITFIAVAPMMNKFYVIRGWRGDNVETTASDIMDKYLQLRGGLRPICQVYDWSSREFGIIASRIGEPFMRADKSRELGAETINTLFKNGMGYIFDIDELQPLAGELINLRNSTNKTVSKDDAVDSFRYAIMQIPFDWSCIVSPEMAKLQEDPKPQAVLPLTPQEVMAAEIEARRGVFKKQSSDTEFDEEAQFWNQLAGN